MKTATDQTIRQPLNAGPGGLIVAPQGPSCPWPRQESATEWPSCPWPRQYPVSEPARVAAGSNGVRFVTKARRGLRHRALSWALVLVSALGWTPAAGTAQEPSHYTLSWTVDVPLLGLGIGGLRLGEALQPARTALDREVAAGFTPEMVNRFDRRAVHRWSPTLVDASEQMATVISVAPVALLLSPRARSEWVELGVMYVQTTLLAGAISEVTKGALPRYRPWVYNPDMPYEQKVERDPGKAFLSSAASYGFARAVFAATVFSDLHPDSPWRPVVWTGALGAATVLGYLRYESGLHYPSDVVAGAAVGAAVGYMVPRLHRTGGGESVSLRPWTHEGGVGLAGTIRF